MGFVSLDSGLLAGQDQIQEMIVVNGVKKGFPSTSALRAVISMLMIQPSNGLLIGDTSDAESVMVSFVWVMMGIFLNWVPFGSDVAVESIGSPTQVEQVEVPSESGGEAVSETGAAAAAPAATETAPTPSETSEQD